MTCACTTREELVSTVTGQYEAGRTIKQIAAELNRSYSYVHRLLSDAGVPRRARGGNKRRPRVPQA